MNLIYIGKLVNTHGLKGEVKLISDFKFKDDVFKINNNIYINKIKYTIKSYRKHKMFDMITLEGIDDIDKAFELCKDIGAKILYEPIDVPNSEDHYKCFAIEDYDGNKIEIAYYDK